MRTAEATPLLLSLILLVPLSACEPMETGDGPIEGPPKQTQLGTAPAGPVAAPPPLISLADAEAAARALGTPAAERTLGEPIAMDEALRVKVGGVRTSPGRIPQLQITIDGKTRDLPLKHTHVDAEVSGHVARVEVRQTYRNPFDTAIEAVYVFPLPENSAVDDMRMEIGDRIISAEIKTRDEARRTYERARSQGKTAALLEQERPNIFTQSVANIAPGETIDVVVRYVQDLTFDGGEYEFVFPMVVGPRFIPGAPSKTKTGTGWARDTTDVPDASRITPPVVGGGMRTGQDISLDLVVDAGAPVTDFDAPTHAVRAAETDGLLAISLQKADELPNRDFVFRYRAAGAEPKAVALAHKTGETGYVSLVLHPPKLDTRELVGDRELVFVVDVSGSMHGRPLGMCKTAMRAALSRLQPSDTFNIITFAGRTQKLFSAPRPANATNIRAALELVSGARAGGGTLLSNAVADALRPEVAGGRHRYVFFLTDGYVGAERPIHAGAKAFVDALKAKGQRARVFAMGTGSSVNRHLLDGLARAGDGLTVYTTNREEPLRAVDRFYRYIDHLVLSDIRVDWGGLDVRDTEPDPVPDLFASRPVILHARYGRAGEGTVTITARAGRKRITMKVPVTLPAEEKRHGALGTLWARSRIAGHERELWDGDSADAKAKITELGLAHRIVTAWTSFVAVDHSRKVGDGTPATVVQPVEAAEGVSMRHALPAGNGSAGFLGSTGVGQGLSHAFGAGGLGMKGTGTGGGGHGFGRIRGMGKIDTGAGVLGRKQARRTAKVRMTTKGLGADIRKVIRRRASAFRACYERVLRAGMPLVSRLVLKLLISANGRVSKASLVAAKTTTAPAVGQCVLRVARRLRFPRSARDRVVQFPFVFKPN